MTGSTARQYGAAIALVSGLYSLISATGGGGMMGTGSGWLMLSLGIVVVCHGVVLLTPYASRLGSASGPLMIGYALLMLLNQALVGTTGSTNWGMDGGMGSGMGGGMGSGMGGGMGSGMGGGSGGWMGSAMTGGVAWDVGMVALAVLMLLSGIIMTNADGDGSSM